MYATAVYAVLNPDRRTICMSSAGHPPPLQAPLGGDVVSPALETSLCLLWQELGVVPCTEFRLGAGDRWCLCALRWVEAYRAGVAPKLILSATHESMLELVPLNILREFAAQLR